MAEAATRPSGSPEPPEQPEPPAPAARFRLAPVALAGSATAALAAVAGNQDWAATDDPGADAAFASVASAAADATAPPVTALALVLLATWGVVLVTRGIARRAVTALGLLAALGVVGFAAAAWVDAPAALSATLPGSAASADGDASRTAWSYVGVLAGVGALAASAAGVVSVRRWPEMGRRYDAPVAPGSEGDGRSTVAPAAAASEEQSNLDLWRAIDEGRDPTDGTTP